MRYTCAHCPHLRFEINATNDLAHAQCARMNGAAVPQDTALESDGSWRSIFWRIPIHCPLSNMFVEKSAAQQPVRRWQVRRFAGRLLAIGVG